MARRRDSDRSERDITADIIRWMIAAAILLAVTQSVPYLALFF